MRALIIPAIALALSGCVDLSAVTKFSQTTPDVATLDSLTDVYVSDPKTMSDWQSIWVSPDPELSPEGDKRKQQKVALDALNGLIVDYMKALGDIANSSSADISTEAKSVSSGLSSLQKVGAVNLSTSQVSSIGDLITIVPQSLLNIYRAEELGKIIRQNRGPFDAMVATEIDIVKEAYIPDFADTKKTIDSMAQRTEAAIKSAPDGAVMRSSRFTFQKQSETAESQMDAATDSANNYVKALQSLDKAYDQLAETGNGFGNDTLAQIKPYLDDAQKAYRDVQKL